MKRRRNRLPESPAPLQETAPHLAVPDGASSFVRPHEGTQHHGQQFVVFLETLVTGLACGHRNEVTRLRRREKQIRRHVISRGRLSRTAVNAKLRCPRDADHHCMLSAIKRDDDGFGARPDGTLSPLARLVGAAGPFAERLERCEVAMGFCRTGLRFARGLRRAVSTQPPPEQAPAVCRPQSLERSGLRINTPHRKARSRSQSLRSLTLATHSISEDPLNSKVRQFSLIPFRRRAYDSDDPLQRSFLLHKLRSPEKRLRLNFDRSA